MKTLNFISVVGLFFLLCIQCNKKEQNEKYQLIVNEIKENYQIDIRDNNVQNLIFINDQGCPNCIASFSGYILNNIDKFKENSMIFINSKGINIDLDKFINLKAKNILISRNIREQSEILPDLGIIYLKKSTKEVDSVISLDTSNIVEQLKYISARN